MGRASCVEPYCSASYMVTSAQPADPNVVFCILKQTVDLQKECAQIDVRCGEPRWSCLPGGPVLLSYGSGDQTPVNRLVAKAFRRVTSRPLRAFRLP